MTLTTTQIHVGERLQRLRKGSGLSVRTLASAAPARVLIVSARLGGLNGRTSAKEP